VRILAGFLMMALLPSCAPNIARRQVDALWYREQPGKPPAFGITKIEARVVANPEEQVRVGVFEEYAGATGAEWRSSVWVASFMSCLTLGCDFTRKRFSISVGGYMDGPSAGAIMAVAFMAAMTGQPLRPDTTMTGGIGPDGSILPVGGIPEKLRAAVRTGKRRVGIPAGQAVSLDKEGNPVDLIALGRSLGLEVREVADLRQAYQLLTGQRLPGPVPLPRERMAIPRSMAKNLRARVSALLRRAADDAKAAARDPSSGVQRRLLLAHRAMGRARAYLARGDVDAAYFRALRAAINSEAARHIAQLSGERWQAMLQLELAQAQSRLATIEEGLEAAARVGTDPLSLLAAHGAVARANGLLGVTRALVGGPLAEKGRKGLQALRKLKASQEVFAPAIYLSQADLAVVEARDALQRAGRVGPRVRFDPDRLRRAARSLVSAATGNLDFIDSLLLRQVASEMKKPLEEVRTAFAMNEHRYLLSAQLAEMALEKSLGGASDLASRLQALAAAGHSYVDSAVVIARYYGLDSELTAADQAKKIRRERALDALLRRAEVTARSAAALTLRDLGLVLPEAQLLYQAGIHQAKGTLSERLRGLARLWLSTLASRVAWLVLRRTP
jgi:hypothetical protein